MKGLRANDEFGSAVYRVGNSGNSDDASSFSSVRYCWHFRGEGHDFGAGDQAPPTGDKRVSSPINGNCCSPWSKNLGADNVL